MLTSNPDRQSIQSLTLEDPAIPHLNVLGDADLLDGHYVGLLCSIRCPGDVILKSYDLAREFRKEGIPVVGGFHSPMEKECLRLLLRGKQPVVVCPARGLEGMRIPGEWKKPLEEGRLAVVSAFDGKVRRATRETARKRNDLVAALAKVVFVAHAEPGGEIERVATQAKRMGKPVLGFEEGESVEETVGRIRGALG